MAMNKKSLPHQNRSKSQPPTIGPVAMPIPVVAPHSPMARARSRRSVNTFTSNERVDGNMSAAPIPMTARAAMSSPVVPDAAPARLPTAKTVRPMSSVPLRPKRSLRLPGGEDQGGKDEAVGVHHPLELRRRGPDLSNQGGQRHVHDRDIDADHEGGEAEGNENQRASVHAFFYKAIWLLKSSLMT